ncbi:MAG: hypothetical protein IJE59_05080 [Clostridia bacterium]|nr:hypothetical protein [Clostridia bacterium]
MNFFTKKNFLFKLIISICIILAIINCSGLQKVYAANESGVGGNLLSPIGDLVLGLGDAVMNVLQKAVMGTDATLELDNTKKIDWGAVVLWVVIIAVVVAATIITAGGVWAALGPMLVTAAKIAAIYGAICLATGGAAHTVVTSIVADALTDTVVLPTYNIGPEEIFSGRILLFDANIFNPKEVWVEYNTVGVDGDGKQVTTGSNTVTLEHWNTSYENADGTPDYAKNATTKFNSENQPKSFYYMKGTEKIETSINNSAYELRDVISKWYYIIRTIALVGSMLILLYIGIRIIISSIAEEKAKYKQMLGDWVIALCLIFLMHYIMIFAHNIVDSITDMFTNSVNQGTNAVTIVEPNNTLRDSVKDLESEEGQYWDKDAKIIKWPTNLMGRIRMEAQKKDGTVGYIGYVIAYVVLVIYTLTFSFTYIKRLLYLLFLTVMSPFVALTYPIDKIHDGKAQAFDMWLKEYIFNLLIQPFHLLLYTIFVSMAFELSSTNIIYTLVVLGFMMPAEKFLRTMFGFNKASTPGMLAGAAGAAMAMSAVNSLGKFAKGGRGGKDNGGKGQGKNEQEQTKIRTSDSSHSQEALYASLASSDGDTNSNQRINAGNELNNLPENNNLKQERERLASERSVLEEFEEEGAVSDNWTDEDYEAYQELEREQLENEARLREQEQQERFGQQENNGEQEEEPLQVADTVADNNTTDQNKRKISIPRGVRAGGKLIGRGIVSGGKYLLKTGANVAFKGALATTGGMIGLAAGIASGDPSKAFQNTTVGAGAGIAVASGISNRASRGIKKSVDDFNREKETVLRDYYGADYNQYMREQYDKEFMKDKQARRMYKEQLGLSNKEEVDQAMRDAVKYREYGINDNNIIIKAMKSDNGNAQNRADKRRIAAAKLAETSKNEKDLQAHMKRFASTKGITEHQVKDMERMVRSINNL